MTNDFKEQLLNYLTGTIQTETPPDNPTYYIEKETLINNLYTNITNEIGSNNFSIVNVIQSKTNSNIVINGKNTTNNNSFLIITDEKFNILSYFDEFSSGVSFRMFTGFNIDENGYFYTIESDHGLQLNNKRFLMLNNIAVPNANGEYQVKIRKSYSIPNTTVLYNNSIQGLYKAVGQSIYVILNADNNANRYLTKLTINVGASNNWEDNAINGVVGNDQILSVDSEGNILFKTINVGIPSGAYTYNISLYTYNNGVETTETITDTIINSTNMWRATAKFLNINEAYMGYKTSDTSNTYTEYIIGHLDTTTKILTKVFSTQSVYSAIYNDTNFLMFYRIDNEMMFKFNVITNSSTNEFNIIIGRLIGLEEQNTLLASGITPLTTNVDFFIVVKTFNLYQYLSQYNNNAYSTKEIYQSNGYNGDSYIDTNCLIPNISYFYNNGKLVYARTLYNKQINGNTTTSTVEIPNNYLNGISIQPNQLLGQTNLILNNDTEEFIKNIYETVDINFINTINIQNNDGLIDNEISSLFNYFINTTRDYTDYQQSIIRRALINYTDEDLQTINLTSSLFIQNGTEGQYEFVIYVPEGKTVDNIQFTNYNYMRIYNTISNLNLEGGKYYKIIQPVEVV